MTPAHKEVIQELQNYVTSAPTAKALMEWIAKRLHEKMTRYNWVGFYLVDPTDSGYLIVGPYAGSFTPNARIALSNGLCGAAATMGKVVVVQDVSRDPRYLAGTSMNKTLAAEMDVESYFVDTFTKEEQKFVEACADVIAKKLEKGP
jgi:L-methionine (R)-S-oxide reductase